MDTRTTRLQSMLLLLLLFVTPRTEAQDSDSPLTAKQILDHMASTYANCRSYRDAGVVNSQIEVRKEGKVERQQKEQINFTTAFVRPDRFRFEYKKDSKGRLSRGIVWRKGNEVQTWSNLLRLPKFATLSRGVAVATGVSDGSAQTIPVLLMPKDVSGWRLTQMTDTNLIENAKQDKQDCFCLVGRSVVSQLNMHNQLTLWIDKKTFLVRQIDEKRQWKFDAMDYVEERMTTYDAAIDADIPDKMLLFDPPAPSADL